MEEKDLHLNYPQRLRFKCNLCGICCGDTPQKARHVLLLNSEAEKIATEIKQPLSVFANSIKGKGPYAFEIRKNEEGKCQFLEKTKCKIYDNRPLICRFYPFQLEITENRTATFKATAECPGLFKNENEREGLVLDARFFEHLLKLAESRLVS